MSKVLVQVDLAAITHNVAVLRALANKKVMAIVKADGYGHGLVPAAQAARAGGADWLGVAQVSEAAALRAAGDAGPLLAWLYGVNENLADLITQRVTLSVSNPHQVRQVAAAAAAVDEVAEVHIALDSGMGREGALLAELPDLLGELARSPNVTVSGLWSHFANADNPGHASIIQQRSVFQHARRLVTQAVAGPVLTHLDNSAALLHGPGDADMARLGLATYGYSPLATDWPIPVELRPAMTVAGEVVAVKKVPAGQGVSYGHEYVTAVPTHLALVSCGYADGLPRSASGRALVRIRGAEYAIAGRVCMDQIVLDVGSETDVAPGDIATFFGPDGPDLAALAKACGTIPYELLCSFGCGRAKDYQ